MALQNDLTTEVRSFFAGGWQTTNGLVVPHDGSVTLGKDAVQIDATVLYADLADSTVLVDTYTPTFAAEVYKSFLHCASKIIRAQGGTITAFDGDRVMAVFIGASKNTSAVKAALKINAARLDIIQPEINRRYNTNFVMNHVCGLDTSTLFVAKTGIRGSNDLVWVGRAANYAAKLAAFDHNHPTWITGSVYDMIANEAKFAGNGTGANMWEERLWTSKNNLRIYRSTYKWTPI
jgi:class 3 adenylate cyclase